MRTSFGKEIKFDQWYKKLYLWRYGGFTTSQTDNNFTEYEKKIQNLKSQRIYGKAKDDLGQAIPEKIKTGTGYHGSNSMACSRSILDDVSRLEVLIGGKRAGNNSPEIINEAAEICQRLFQGHVIDNGLYSSLIDELTDDY